MNSTPMTVLLAVALLGACDSPTDTATGGASNSSSATASAKPPPPDEPEEEGVEIVDKGKEPRSLLRYAPKPGQSETLTLTSTTSTALAKGKKKAQGATATQKLALTFQDKGANGQLSYQFEIADVEAAFGEGTSAAVRKSAEELFEKMTGTKGSLVASDRGLVKSAQIKMAEDASPELTAALSELEKNLGNLIFVLPTARVGVGAKWRHTHRFATSGMTVDQVADYVLKSVDKSKVEVAVTTTHRAKDQKLTLGPGMTMDVLAYDGEGTASVTLDLGHLGPALATSVMQTESTMKQGARPKKTAVSTFTLKAESSVD